jgi:hypothetical protein
MVGEQVHHAQHPVWDRLLFGTLDGVAVRRDLLGDVGRAARSPRRFDCAARFPSDD